jgi:MFS family permease
LNLIAVGYSLGLAASVLWLGALGDRYGRKLMLVLGQRWRSRSPCSRPYAPSDRVLFVARLGGGLSAGMAFPTTLALITALWSGPHGRSRSRCGRRSGAPSRARAAVSRAAARALLVGLGLPDHVAARGRGAGPGRASRPGHVNEGTDPVDNLGGILSALLVGALILGINFAAVPNEGTLVAGLAIVAARLRDRVRHPPARGGQPPVRPARRRPARFWVAACAGSSCSAR